MKNSKQIRMCLSCRHRNRQKSMVQLQESEDGIISHLGKGRSFYICLECIENKKRTKGLAKRFKEDEERFVKFLKELVKYG